MTKPYIGLNDFMSSDQVERIEAFWKKSKKPECNRRLHVGVMMTYKTLRGLPTKWTKAVPKNKEIGDILYFLHSDSMRCLHYADYRQPAPIVSELQDAIYFGGAGMNALQLDMIWPQPDQIKYVIDYSVSTRLEVILQVGKDALDQVGNNPHKLVTRLRDYKGVITHTLLDMSMGTGKEVNPVTLEPFLDQISTDLPELSLVVAGGLGPRRMDPIKPLLKKYPNLSFDAQSWIRQSGNALDPVDWDMAEAFLGESLGIVSV